MYPAHTLRTFWDHQVRWARTVRLCRPLSYVGLLFTQGLPWALLAAIVAPVKWVAGVYLLAYLILRLAMAWTVGSGRGGPGLAPQDLAGAAAGRRPLRDLAGEFWFESRPLGQRRICHSPGSNGAQAGGQRAVAKPAEHAPRS